MNTAVAYLSKTGHSKKIAQAISTELSIPVYDIKSSPEINGVDLLFIVGGIYGGSSDPLMLEYIKKLDSSMVKRVVLVTSCTSKVTRQEKVSEALTAKGINVASDEFICQGSFLFFGLTHPNKKDIENAVSFAKNMLK